MSEQKLKFQHMLEACQHSSVMLLNLINDLLDLAKDQNLSFEFHHSFSNLKQVANRALKTLDFMATSKNIMTSVIYDEDDLKYFENVYFDQSRLEQILLNFVSNAIKFSNNSGSVVIKLACRPVEDENEPRVCELKKKLKLTNEKLFKKVHIQANYKFVEFEIAIKDTGQGISEDGLANLFQDFSRLKEHSANN